MSHVLVNKNVSGISEKLYLDKELSDVQFTFKHNDEIELVPAHKLILASQSPVFNRMFYGALKENAGVEIVDTAVDEFTEFLQFFYLNEVTLTMKNIEAVVRLADKYDVLGHIGACVAYLERKLTPNIMCWGYQLAIHLDNQSLIKFCEQKISATPKAIFVTDTFKCCSKAVLKRILELPMSIEEVDIFKAVLEWGKQACINNDLDENSGSNLRAQIGDCLQLIRFNEIKIQDVAALHSSRIGLFTSAEFEDIILLLTIEGYQPKIFNPSSRPISKCK